MRFGFHSRLFVIACALMLAADCGAAANVRAQIVDASGAPYLEAVVALYAPTPADFPQPATAIMDQRGRQYDPHILVVRKNTLVRFPNSDDIRHQVYSFSPAKRFELRLYHGQHADPVLFDVAGEVVLGCNIHDQMVGYIYVVDTPWFARTDERGLVAIANVPPGRYKAKLWYPGVALGATGLEQAVSIAADEVTLKFRVDSLPASPAEPTSDLQQLFKRRGADVQ
jgi:plastocyanin